MWARNMFESCVEIRNHFSDYLDDLCTPEARKSIRYHLSFCEACQEQLEQWQSVREELRALPRRQVPPELALRLRVQMSQRLHQNPLSRSLGASEECPQAVADTGNRGSADGGDLFLPDHGVAGGSDYQHSRRHGALVTPARVQELAPMDFNTGDNGLVLVTQINAEGRVKGYRVLSGQSSPELMQRLDRMIYFSIFRPATMFGKPTDGQVVLSLRRITVRG